MLHSRSQEKRNRKTPKKNAMLGAHWARLGSIALALVYLSCAGPPPPSRPKAPARATPAPMRDSRLLRSGPPATPAPTPRTDNVLLVTVDGVRWQEIFGGVDPVLAKQAHLPRAALLSARKLLPNLYRL